MTSRHYSPRTEKAYVLRTRRFVRLLHLRHLAKLGEEEVNAFLTHLAAEEKVAASIRNQALSALLFLHRTVVGRDLGDLGTIVRARRSTRLPVMLSREEVHRRDLDEGFGRGNLPRARARKYPRAPTERRWRWRFPQRNRWVNRKTGEQGRRHPDPSILQRAVRDAVRRAGIQKKASCHTLRHSFATHLLER